MVLSGRQLVAFRIGPYWGMIWVHLAPSLASTSIWVSFTPVWGSSTMHILWSPLYVRRPTMDLGY